jgi:hypothetical protein
MKSTRYRKYGNTKTEVDGIKFDSKKEANRWSELKLLAMAGKIRNLKRQVPIRCEVNGVLVCKYIADFTYDEECNAGFMAYWGFVVEDAKGFKTEVYKLKKKLVEACHGFEIREV